jgi:hypothetical protein
MQLHAVPFAMLSWGPEVSEDYERPFSISRPDRDGVVWLCDASGRRRLKLGREDVVAEQVTQFLRAIDDAKRGPEIPTPQPGPSSLA